MIGRNDDCWCGSKKKWKKCHWPKEEPSKESDALAKRYLKQYGIILKNQEQIQKIRVACQLAAKILDELCSAAKEGVTTNELDRLSAKLHSQSGAIPAPLGYGTPPYPKTICTSLNEVICHGIPNDIPLKQGDILNIDVSCILDGYFGDCSRMIQIGKVGALHKLVCETAYECLMGAIKILKPGIPISAIGDEIEKVARSRGCSVVDQFVGHGVGVAFHEPPQIPHCYNKISTLLVPGMTFTIEPMINAGVKEGVIDPGNKWEARTKDGKPSGQEEHTLLITEQGYEILTLLERQSPPLSQ